MKIKSLHLKNSDDIRLYMFKVCSILHELKQYEITMENTLTLIILNQLSIELNLYALNMSQKFHDQIIMPALKDLLFNMKQKHN